MFGGPESYLEEAHSVASLLAGLYSSIKNAWTALGQILDKGYPSSWWAICLPKLVWDPRNLLMRCHALNHE